MTTTTTPTVIVPIELLRQLLDAASDHCATLHDELSGTQEIDPATGGQTQQWIDQRVRYTTLSDALDVGNRLWLDARYPDPVAT